MNPDSSIAIKFAFRRICDQIFTHHDASNPFNGLFKTFKSRKDDLVTFHKGEHEASTVIRAFVDTHFIKSKQPDSKAEVIDTLVATLGTMGFEGIKRFNYGPNNEPLLDNAVKPHNVQIIVPFDITTDVAERLNAILFNYTVHKGTLVFDEFKKHALGQSSQPHNAEALYAAVNKCAAEIAQLSYTDPHLVRNAVECMKIQSDATFVP